jgi:putative transposase
MRQIVKRTIQELLEAEMNTEHVGVAPLLTQRGAHRPATATTTSRGPYAPRWAPSSPSSSSRKDRQGTFSTWFFSRYQRNEEALVVALMEMYPEGVTVFVRSRAVALVLRGRSACVFCPQPLGRDDAL